MLIPRVGYYFGYALASFIQGFSKNNPLIGKTEGQLGRGPKIDLHIFSLEWEKEIA